MTQLAAMGEDISDQASVAEGEPLADPGISGSAHKAQRLRVDTLAMDNVDSGWVRNVVAAATPFAKPSPPQTVAESPADLDPEPATLEPGALRSAVQLNYQTAEPAPAVATSPWAQKNSPDAAPSAPGYPPPPQQVPAAPSSPERPPPIVKHAPLAGAPAHAAAHPVPHTAAQRPAARPTPPPIRPLDPLRASTPAVGIIQIEPQAKAPKPAPAAPANEMAGDSLQLLWFNPKLVPRMRRQASWRDLLDNLQDEAADPEVDDEALDKDAVEVEDNRDTFEILTRAQAHTPAQLNEVILRGKRRGGKFVPPIALFAGVLSFPFDAIEELKATIAIAQPFASADETLAEAIKDASLLLDAPHLMNAPEVTSTPIKRIHEAFRRIERIVPRNHLDDQKRRALLTKRHYQHCDCFGADHIRALLHSTEDSRDGVPTYLPAELGKQLPMFERFRARLIAIVEPAISQFESHPVSLRAAALGRISPLPLIGGPAPPQG